NVIAVYLIALRPAPAIAAAILLALAVLIFVPIRYVYPSRTVFLRPLTLALGAAWTLVFVAVILGLPPPEPAVPAIVTFSHRGWFWSARVRSRRTHRYPAARFRAT